MSPAAQPRLARRAPRFRRSKQDEFRHPRRPYLALNSVNACQREATALQARAATVSDDHDRKGAPCTNPPVPRRVIAIAHRGASPPPAAAAQTSTSPRPPPRRPASHAAKNPVPPGRIAFRRYLDDAQHPGRDLHGSAPTAPGRDAGHPTRKPDALDDMPDWSPDGRVDRLPALQRRRWKCSVWTVKADGSKAATGPLPLPPRRLRFRPVPRWTPDGRLVATLEQGRVRTFGGAPQIQQVRARADRPGERGRHRRRI